MDGGDGWARFAQCHALDQLNEFCRELSIARIRSFGFYQADQPSGAVAGKPTLNGSQWNTGITCGLRQRHIIVEVWPEHRKAHHELLNRQREATERRREENPALPYRMDAAARESR